MMRADLDESRVVAQILVNALLDDDDEKLILKENSVFAKFIAERNRTRMNGVSIFFNSVLKQEDERRQSLVDNETPINDCVEETQQEQRIEKKKQMKTYDDSFYEHFIPRLTIEEFKVHFGMTRSAAAKLMERLVPLTERYPHSKKVPLRKRVLLCLWILRNEETYRAVGERFGMAHGNCHYLFVSVCGAICKIAEDSIIWPSRRKQRSIALEIEGKYGLPGTVGVIGSCQLTIKTPEKNTETFYNHQGTPCIILQGVCDHKLTFLDVYAGQTGSANYRDVFNSSPVCEKLEEIILPEHHLVGERCFPLLPRVITPYVDELDLTEDQQNFNNTIKPVTKLITKAFSFLRNRFKRLNFLDMQRVDLMVKVVLAACVLHNHILECEEDDVVIDYILDETNIYDVPFHNESIISAKSAACGNEKRNLLVSRIAESKMM